MTSWLGMGLKLGLRLGCGLGLALLPLAANAAPSRTVTDLSDIRGFNYTPASVDHYALWTQYNPDEVDRDFGYAGQLKLNNARIFVRYADWLEDPVRFRKNFDSFMAIAARHHIGIMLVLSPVAEAIDNKTGQAQKDADAKLDVWARAILAMAKAKPIIRFWDVANEPDLPSHGADNVAHRMAFARRMAGLVHAADKHWLTTAGCFRETCMEALEPYTDVLSYHDYSPTVAEIDGYIVRAQAFAAKVHKPVMNTETGCVGRGNPYDVTLREYNKAHMGFFLWELRV